MIPSPSSGVREATGRTRKPVVSSASELIAARAHVVIANVEHRAIMGPCIYAAFMDDGRCRYVGSAKTGLHRPLQPSHHKLREGGWDRLFVWAIASDVDLEALEVEAINALCPLDNQNPPSPLSIRKRSPRWEHHEYFMNTGEIAKRLGVTRKFVVGEILEERLDAMKRTLDSGRTIYRVHCQDYFSYLRRVWRPTSRKRLSIAARILDEPQGMDAPQETSAGLETD